VHCPSRGVDRPEGARLCTERRGLAERRAAPTEAEARLAVGSVSHKSLSFEREVIETALHRADDDAAERYADALDVYSRLEPLPWADFIVRPGRVLAACGRGAIGAAMAGELTGLYAESRNIGSRAVLPSLGATLTGEQPGLASA
jgi:hypothetical protein